MGAISYRMQVKRYGGLTPAIRQRLGREGSGDETPSLMKSKSATSVTPGARFIREWNGSTHVVEVVEGGFIWNGMRHRSLSAIARAITGTKWSGPRFFALREGS